MNETWTPTLTAFLDARLAEDEATAHESLDHPWRVGHQNSCDWWGDMPGYCTCDGTTRVLAEVAAKRRILARYAAAVVEWEGNASWSVEPVIVKMTLEDDVKDLASVYADHPDFNPEWR